MSKCFAANAEDNRPQISKEEVFLCSTHASHVFSENGAA
jgi:hypothetical protein